MDNKKIVIKDASVVFANLKDEGFGRSITIDATDHVDAITKWVKDNNIGKGDRAGVASFKEYEGKKQFSFKMNDSTKFAAASGVDSNAIGFGAKVSLVAVAFDYDNKFGKGTSSVLTAVLVERAARTASDDDLQALLGDGGEANEITPQEPVKDTVVNDVPSGEIDMSDIENLFPN